MSKGGNLNTQSNDTPFGNADRSYIFRHDILGHACPSCISKHKDLIQSCCLYLSVFGTVHAKMITRIYILNVI